MSEEIVFVVDNRNVPLGECTRARAVKERLWRRTAGGIVIDPALNLVLCQRRSLTKDERPGLWVATFGGKSRPNELPEDTASRELHEELGLTTEPTNLIFTECFRSEERRQFEYVFLVKIDSTNCNVSLRDGEATESQWIPSEGVMLALQHDTNWYHYGYEVALLRRQTRT